MASTTLPTKKPTRRCLIPIKTAFLVPSITGLTLDQAHGPRVIFEGKMAVLLRWANALKSSNRGFAEAQSLLEGEGSVIGRVIRRSKTSDFRR
jgi:hypothetical protein